MGDRSPARCQRAGQHQTPPSFATQTFTFSEPDQNKLTPRLDTGAEVAANAFGRHIKRIRRNKREVFGIQLHRCASYTAVQRVVVQFQLTVFLLGH